MAITGDKSQASDLNAVIQNINNTRIKWGLTNLSPAQTGDNISATTFEQLKVALDESKLKSGSTADTSLLTVNKGAFINSTILDTFISKSTEIYNHCSCDCNNCSCDCDRCSCDCDRCSCDCNNCSCDCNNCSCDCNRCSCNCDYGCGCEGYGSGCTGDSGGCSCNCAY